MAASGMTPSRMAPSDPTPSVATASIATPSFATPSIACVLVTGGAGYIGTHTIVELLRAGRRVICLDNFVNSSTAALARAQELGGGPVIVERGDVRDAAFLRTVFDRHAIDGVIHFAALKAVGESVARPLDYYDNNVTGSLALLAACAAAGVRRFVFSSSATVYGASQELPLTESLPLSATNPYGATKVMVERILRDACVADPLLSVVSLRYFNPIGAHESGRIGEDPRGTPNNLFPLILQVAIGRRQQVEVFGDDWPTTDGSGVRDYLHVVDLALGHLRALDYAATSTGCVPVNLGTGRGTSVLQLLAAFEHATGRTIARHIAPRRPGDVAACWADVTRARELLGWTATRSVEQMCADGWRWQKENPAGYG
jgi:UDP-glucose 4-epimerase